MAFRRYRETKETEKQSEINVSTQKLNRDKKTVLEKLMAKRGEGEGKVEDNTGWKW